MDQKLAAQAAHEAIRAACERVLTSTPTTIPAWCRTALPYLKAIRNNDYGLEDPVMCVLYALNNLTSWRGEQARRVKIALNEAIK